MPELPDVEGFRKALASCARDRRIEHVDVVDPGVLRQVTPGELRRGLEGHRFGTPERHGKWLIARTDGPALLLHFGMTGRLVCCAHDDPRDRHDRVVLAVDGGDVRFRDQRKLQGIRLAEDDEAVARILADQGPDAMSVGEAEFGELLGARRARVKAVLIDQSVIAGLGNLLADEILWRARLHPARSAAGLGGGERERLHREMRRVLRESARVGHVPPRDSWLTGRRDDEEPACPRCGRPLRRGRVAGRGTVWCPRCQPEGS
jgi:formamidopyrimidine-DNA glycosylase